MVKPEGAVTAGFGPSRFRAQQVSTRKPGRSAGLVSFLGLASLNLVSLSLVSLGLLLKDLFLENRPDGIPVNTSGISHGRSI